MIDLTSLGASRETTTQLAEKLCWPAVDRARFLKRRQQSFRSRNPKRFRKVIGPQEEQSRKKTLGREFSSRSLL
jgi:hypothetical protein